MGLQKNFLNVRQESQVQVEQEEGNESGAYKLYKKKQMEKRPRNSEYLPEGF